MNVTLGVPRIKEIINASPNISTPIITVVLEKDDDVRSARIVKGRIEKTLLRDVVENVETLHAPDGHVLRFHLAKSCIEALHLDINPTTIKRTIEGASRITKHKELRVEADSKNWIVAVEMPREDEKSSTRGRSSPTPSDSASGSASSSPFISQSARESHSNAVFSIDLLKRRVLSIVVSGIPTVNRAVVNINEKPGQDDDGKERYHLLVEGLGLLDVMSTPGVQGTKTKTNHIMEVERVLGIEAARSLVMKEIAYIFGRYGLAIDSRHLMLLSDVMSYRGKVLGIQRHGIAQMKQSVLMLASFERTADHLFDAAAHARVDRINGVSECIILGVPIPIGTGLFKLMSSSTSLNCSLKGQLEKKDINSGQQVIAANAGAAFIAERLEDPMFVDLNERQ